MMKVFFSARHAAHCVKGEFDGVRLIAPYEVPARVELVRREIEARKLGSIEAPQLFGSGPIAAVHDTTYMEFLTGAFAAFTRKHGRDVVEAYPSSWPARALRQVPGIDIDGRLGYYAFDVATPILRGTHDAALAAVDCALSAAADVKSGAKTSFALCRPPGHHAASDIYGGYCYFNNAAVAAQWLAANGLRVAILDVDYHHGNGTQAIFYSRKDILTVSIHADPAHAYPHFLGFADEGGEGEGEGYNLNLPLPLGTHWTDYARALGTALERVRGFAPDVLIVPMGLDTYELDPISKFKLKADDYFRLGEALGALGVPIVITMEGGYALNDLGRIAANTLEGILNGA